MESSETPIQPGRSGADRVLPVSSLQGTVMSLKKENGVQTVEIQSAQGKIKLQAEGDFQVGERIRVSMPAGGAIRLEKIPLPAGPQDWQGVGYQMKGDLATLRSVRAFEEQLVNWVGSRQPGSPAAGAAGQGLAGMAPGSVPGSALEPLLRLPLPELLKRVLAREGGRDMLMQALAALSKEGYASLMAGLDKGRSDGSKASLLAMLRGMRRDSEAGTAADAGTPGPASGGKGPEAAPGNGSRGEAARSMGAFWPGKEGSVPWMGRVLERQESGGAMAFAGGKPISPAPQAAGAGADRPLIRYLLDLGGRTLEVQSAQSRQVGDLVDFEMEKGARMQARFLEPALALPAGLRAEYAGAPAEARAGLQLSARYLAEFKDEPYFEKLVRDFGGVLAQGGRLAVPEGAPSLKPGNLPDPKELDAVLRLFLAFPRDREQPEGQARTWSEALRDPKAMADLLRTLKPEAEASLLRSGTSLRLASALPGKDMPTAGPSMEGADRPEDVLAALLRKALPAGFKSSELVELAARLAGSPSASPAPEPGAESRAASDAKPAHFLLQAFAGLVPREDEMREGRPNPFYFYHNQEWKGLQITWERDREKGSRGKRDASAPVKVRVETQAQHMGKVDVGVVLQGGKATLDFRNQFHDVRGLLAEDMPELEKSLAILDVHIEAWTYGRMADQPNVLPTAGWVRPASLDGGNLDLTG